RADHPLLDDLHGDGERTALDEGREVLGLLGAEVAGDLRGPAGDADAAGHALGHLRRGDDLAVQDDRDAPLVADGAGDLGGQLLPDLAALALEVDVDGPPAEVLRVVGGVGLADALSGERGGPDEDLPPALVRDELLALLLV